MNVWLAMFCHLFVIALCNQTKINLVYYLSYFTCQNVVPLFCVCFSSCGCLDMPHGSSPVVHVKEGLVMRLLDEVCISGRWWRGAEFSGSDFGYSVSGSASLQPLLM